MNKNLADAGRIKDILSRHGFHFSKSLGQNFLVNPSVCPRMAEMCGAAGKNVIEIGPGIGVLTVELAKRAQKVVAIELDERLMPVLKETLDGLENIKILNADVMDVNLSELIDHEFSGDTVVCANLPYYITSPILMHLLESRLPVSAITVMVQKEAAVRICAKPGTREAGAVSLAVHYYAQPRILFDVSSGSFMPRPRVDSCVIRLDIRKAPPVSTANEKLMFQIIRASFNQRRKTILNALSSGLKLPREVTGAALESAGVRPGERGERLTLNDFARIADALCADKE